MNAVKDNVAERSAAVADGVQDSEWWRAVRVRDMMTSPTICVDRSTTVTEAQALMQKHDIRRVPVLDDGKLVGILTQGDVRGAMPSEATTLNRTEQDYLINQLKVERVMTGDIIAAKPEMSLADAARLMAHHKISGLPVVDGEDVVGLISESDIFEMVVAMFDKLDAR